MKTLKHNIKRILFIMSIFFTTFTALAQAPNKMSYQSVVRNASNTLVANANVGIQISILQTTATGTAVYVERHTALTNANGLSTIEIGGGTLISGSFATIDWSNGPFFIKTQTDPLGGTNYTITGTSQLLSVPFALFAASSGGSQNSWNKNGNVTTVTDFIGNTNNVDLIFKRNGLQNGRIGTSNLNFGEFSLFNNITSANNTAIGARAMQDNTTGNFNTAVGTYALNSNVSSNLNVALGWQALTNGTGQTNTALGSNTLYYLSTGNNNTAVGYEAQVATSTGNNQLRIGNTAVTLASAQVSFTTTSDKRWKSNIQPCNLGVEFIKQLNPVHYTRKDVHVYEGKTTILETTTNPTVEYGFIAQELETTLNNFKASNNGIISKDDEGMYGVRYNDLLAPMVKAMQEQQVIIESQARTIEEMLVRLKSLENKK